MLGLDTLQTAFEACHDQRWQRPMLCGLAWALFTVVTAGGFLWVVGIHPYAMVLAFVPSAVFLLGLVFTFWGAVWAAQSPMPGTQESWFDWLGQGVQLCLFHAMWAVFVLSLGYLLLPWGACLVLLYGVLLPMGMVSMVLSAQNRSFLGLMEASLRIFQVPIGRLLLLWAELFAYHLFWGALIFPLACFALLLSVVGIPLIPVAALIFVQGSAVLVHNALEESVPECFTTAPLTPQPAYSQAAWPQASAEGFRRFNSFNGNPPE